MGWSCMMIADAVSEQELQGLPDKKNRDAKIAKAPPAATRNVAA
jgi:hypothetical protein